MWVYAWGEGMLGRNRTTGCDKLEKVGEAN